MILRRTARVGASAQDASPTDLVGSRGVKTSVSIAMEGPVGDNPEVPTSPTTAGTPEEPNLDVPDASLEIRSVTDLLKVVAGARASGPRWYRGQRDRFWGLQPAVGRNSGHLTDEAIMLKQFKRDAINRTTQHPTTSWGWIALAQHFGLPTRLMDWTEHPLVALFFAAELGGEEEHAPTDGAFFELDPEALNLATYPETPRILMLDHDSELDDYLPEARERPRSGPLAVTALRAFDRLIVQVGTFTVCQRGEDLDGHDAVRKWIVPASAKAEIQAELADLNITPSTVFPDLSHLAAQLKGQYAR